MGLQRLDLGVPPGQLFLIDPVKQVTQLPGHLIKGAGEVLKFPAARALLNLVAQLPLADPRRSFHQFPDGPGNLLAEEAEGKQQQQ